MSARIPVRAVVAVAQRAVRHLGRPGPLAGRREGREALLASSASGTSAGQDPLPDRLRELLSGRSGQTVRLELLQPALGGQLLLPAQQLSCRLRAAADLDLSAGAVLGVLRRQTRAARRAD